MVPVSARLPAGVTASSTVPVRSDVATTGCVIGAGDGHLDGAVDGAAIAVVQRDGELLDLGLVLGEVFHRRGRDAVIPGHHAAETGAGGVRGDARGQRAQRAGRGHDGRVDAVSVGEVDVGEGDGAGVGRDCRPG